MHNILLNYQPNYNSNIKSQNKGFSNQLIFAQSGKTGGDEGKTKEEKQNPSEIIVGGKYTLW